MCGITGWFNLNVSTLDRQPLLQRMCAAIAHRGPDDQGFFFDECVGLGFQRLSIVDLEGGHQPMASNDGAIQVVFNGEIFNYVALRHELKQSGLRFKTASDTEVLLRLYERDGLRAFERMNGMFAVAIWDRRKGLFHLVRDRLGVKPLYYARVGESLIFGSEIKAILASGRIQRAVNEHALWDYLTFRYVPAPETIWQGVMKLPPAHSLTLRVDGSENAKPYRWWSVPMHMLAAEKSDPEYEAEFQALFEDAVGLRMRADVPVGITLSGGLDSSAVVAAAKLTAGDLKTFSVAFADSPEIDELPYAREVAREFGTDHHEVVIGQQEFMDFLPDFVWHTDEPLADLASVPLYYVSRLAREHVKVVLSGEGADEILAGYSFDNWARRWDEVADANANMPWWSKGIGGQCAARVSPEFARRRDLAATLCDQRKVPEPITMTNYWSSADKKRLLVREHDWPDSMDRIRSQLSEAGEQHPLNQVLHVYCQDWLVEDLLMKADKMSMANSLELRTPFLDYRLVEWAAALPARLKAGRTKNGLYRTKEILRRYAATRLPPSIVNRPKQGFPVPVYGWLSGALASWATDTLLSRQSHARAWLNPSALSEVVSAGISATAGTMEKHRLWNLLILEIWMQKWLP
jgi:asparagine synthase (glutamine-hydrolysing)